RTSVDSLCLEHYADSVRPLDLNRSTSTAYSVANPAKAGVFDESRMNSVRTIRSRAQNGEPHSATDAPFTPIANGMLPSSNPLDSSQATLRLTQWLESRARKPMSSPERLRNQHAGGSGSPSRVQ